ncbi:MAG: ATP-grasp domain-containing protein, partial [Alphaproteobacteria bacterium]
MPVLPGYDDPAQHEARLVEAAKQIGFPVMIKAAAGGGGRGMRLVREPGALAEALASARREASSSFGDDRLLVERYVERPRHVEVQVFADSHGGCIHLFERDCTLQRRHQKVVEEAPAPGMTAARRAAMGEAAVRAARSVGYAGAGTVEFVMGRDGAFFFMEMNTRLQVEHPVTEMITGLDLVEWQLRVASGEALPLRQEQVAISGHAFEARIYAEDPRRDFLPAAGRLARFDLPAPRPWLRVVAGLEAGDGVAVDYDPMVAKLVVHGPDRAAALRRLDEALSGLRIGGATTNLDFLRRVARDPAFAEAGEELDTGFIDRRRALLVPAAGPPGDAALAFAALAVLGDARGPLARDPWDTADGWRLNAPARRVLDFIDAGEARHRVCASPAAQAGAWRLGLPGGEADA